MNVFKDSKTAISLHWMKPLLLSATITVLVAVFIALIGCQVYTSNGRKTFEERAPGNVRSASVLSENETSDTCWTQSVREPLWSFPEDAELRVHAVNGDIIEVCLVANE
jgi:hypothetical protein